VLGQVPSALQIAGSALLLACAYVITARRAEQPAAKAR
jgi:hypothetical protein